MVVAACATKSLLDHDIKENTSYLCALCVPLRL